VAAHRALADRIERLAAQGPGVKAFREQVLAEIARVVPFDAHVWLLTDPVTRVGTSPLADVPMMPWSDLPRLGRLRYTTRVSRWADLMDEGRSVALLTEETDGELSRSALWDELLQGYGIVDVASMALWDRYGCWAWLDLWRCRPAPPFTATEAATLRGVAGAITRGLREAQARTFADDAEPLRLGGPAVVELDTDLRVRSRTTWAQDALLRLNPPDEPMPPIPAAVYNVAAALVAEESGAPVGPPRSRTHLGAGRWVTLRAARIAPDEFRTEDGIVVTIEPSTADELREVLALAHGLSPREREVLDALATGADTAGIARTLFLSEHTVNDHVKAVLAKTGAPHRQALLARAAGVA